MRTNLLTTILVALAGCNYTETEACISAPDDATCPQPEDVTPGDMFSFDWCEIDVKEVSGSGSLEGSPWTDTGSDEAYCCYPVVARDADPGCAVGRPFTEDDAPVVAPIRPGTGWATDASGSPDAALCEAWKRIAAMEHASIAAFARLTLDLLALGAPHDLIAEVQVAAADEVTHARLAYTRASRYAGQPLAPGPLPFSAPILPSADPVAVAVAAVREGCLGETIGAWLVAHEAERADDPEVRALLSRIAGDEARHAALSWKLVAWLMQVGGQPVREAVIAALGEPLTVPPLLSSAEDTAVLCQRVRSEVLLPAIQTLLAA